VKAAAAPDKAGPGAWLPGFLALAAIWGSSFLFIKVGVAELHPLYLALFRVATGAVTLLVVLAAKRVRPPRDARLWGHLLVVATVGVAVPFALFGYGEQRIPSALAGIWNATTPLIALPVAAFAFRTERMTARKAIGLVLGFLGVLVVLGAWRGVGGTGLTGQLMCLGAAACYGVAIPYAKRFVADSGVPGLVLAAGQLILATAVLAVVAAVAEGPPPWPTALSGGALSSVVTLGALGTGIAFVINFRNIRLAGASTASMVTYLIPIFAIAIGVVALGEGLAWYQPVGTSIVLLGVAISQGVLAGRWRRRRLTPRGHPPVDELAAASSR
jgi:drug/metabolite transporter (DMT)-like permease